MFPSGPAELRHLHVYFRYVSTPSAAGTSTYVRSRAWVTGMLRSDLGYQEGGGPEENIPLLVGWVTSSQTQTVNKHQNNPEMIIIRVGFDLSERPQSFTCPSNKLSNPATPTTN